MNCEWIKNNTSLYVYDELADDARHEFEMHCQRCTGCAKNLEAERAVFSLMSVGDAVEEPSASFLAASRMKLQEALEHTEQDRSFSRYFDISHWFTQMKFAPALALSLMTVGFLGGSFATWNIAKSNSDIKAPVDRFENPDVASASIAGIRAITKDPATNKVTIQYDTLAPQQVEANLDDPKVQQLLLYAAKNNANSGVRMDSVNLLTANPQQQPVRQALIFSLKYDTNPGVRVKALEGLAPFVKDDIAVRDALIEALLNDQNLGVRTMAIQSLAAVKADGSVRSTLEALAERDQNTYIKSEARRLVAQLPQID